MSKDLIHLTGEYWGVKVPKGAIAWRVDISGYLLFELPEPGINGEFYYDDWKPGQWEIVVLAKDITEEIAKGICLGQKIKNAQLRLENIIYPKYDEEFDGEIQCCLTALESFQSLLKSKNLNPSTTLIIKLLNNG